ncbi:MAG: DUF1674 domain-containing protein [Bdellovibrionales bacterium]
MTDKEKSPEKDKKPAPKTQEKPEQEINGRGGLEPTRYDDWEIKGKCVDF